MAQYTSDIKSVQKDYKVVSVTVDGTDPPVEANVIKFREVLGRPARKIVFLTTTDGDTVTFKVNPYHRAKKRHEERVDETVYLAMNSVPDFTSTVAATQADKRLVFDDCTVDTLSISAATVGGVVGAGGSVDILVF